MLPEPVQCPIYFHEDIETIVISVPAAAGESERAADARSAALDTMQRIGTKLTAAG